LLIPQYFIYLALVAWVVTFYGLVCRLFTAFRKPLA